MSLFNVLKEKTVFSKVIVVRCYKMVFFGFGKFHQKKFSALPPLPQLLLSMGQFTQVVLCACAFKEPAEGENSSSENGKSGQRRRCFWRFYLSQTLKVPVGNRYCQQFWSSSELKTRSLCFSEVICCCHCFSLLQFLPHSQQWFPAFKRHKSTLQDWQLSSNPSRSKIYENVYSPPPRRSLSACGSVYRSPWQSYWKCPHSSRVSGTAAIVHKADPYLELCQSKGWECSPTHKPLIKSGGQKKAEISLLFSFM